MALTTAPDSPTVLVTGASAGIGVAIAREYAARGWNVALAARRRAPMEHLAAELQASGVKAEVFTCDLFEADAPQTLFDQVTAKMGRIDGLVNNAGYGHPDRYLDSEWSAHANFIHLMLTAPSELAHLCAGPMKDRGFGRIINVASLAGHMPGSKGHTLYAAVKSYLIKFSESLNVELAGEGVHVSALCPGFTFTEFHDVNGTREQLNHLPDFMMQSAEQVAEEGVEACERNKPVYVTGGVNKSIALLARILPAPVTRSLMSKNSEKFRKG